MPRTPRSRLGREYSRPAHMLCTGYFQEAIAGVSSIAILVMPASVALSESIVTLHS